MEQVGLEAFDGARRPSGRRAPQASEVQKVAIGHVVPDFACYDETGKEHRLSDHRGEKVMLCFYRHSHCPAIAHSVGKLAGNYKKLAWASKLKVITVFRTDQKYLGEGLGDGGPIAHFIKEEGAGSGAFRTGTSYPFLALADPQGSAAATFKVESKGFFWHVCDVPRFPRAVRKAIRTKAVADKSKDEAEHIPGAANLLPSEFLIDEQGVLVDVMRSRKASDTMAADRITSFLLGKEKRSAKRNAACHAPSWRDFGRYSKKGVLVILKSKNK